MGASECESPREVLGGLWEPYACPRLPVPRPAEGPPLPPSAARAQMSSAPPLSAGRRRDLGGGCPWWTSILILHIKLGEPFQGLAEPQNWADPNKLPLLILLPAPQAMRLALRVPKISETYVGQREWASVSHVVPLGHGL